MDSTIRKRLSLLEKSNRKTVIPIVTIIGRNGEKWCINGKAVDPHSFHQKHETVIIDDI